MVYQPIEFHGQPAIQLAHADGSRAIIALQGAQVLSWIADEAERLYLSPKSVFDGRTAIRGGVPVCCPQFNQRGPLPKHGFMRNLTWEPVGDADPSAFVMRLRDSAETRAMWPHGFEARLAVMLAPRQLRIDLVLANTGSTAWSFAAALHTYLRVNDIAQVRLEGLQDTNRWDAVRDVRSVEALSALDFKGEFDSVYAAPRRSLHLVEGDNILAISQSDSCTETVVWNPGAVRGATLADMPADGYRHMLCVEAASIDQPERLAPAAEWRGWQQFNVL